MDLTNLLPQVQELQVVLPTGEATDIYLKLVGTDSVQFTNASMKWAAFFQSNPDKAEDLATRRESGIDLTAAFIVGWRGLTTNGGAEAMAYSHDEAVKLIGNPELSFVREQVEGFAIKRANFFCPSAPAANSGGKANRRAKHA